MDLRANNLLQTNGGAADALGAVCSMLGIAGCKHSPMTYSYATSLAAGPSSDVSGNVRARVSHGSTRTNTGKSESATHAESRAGRIHGAPRAGTKAPAMWRLLAVAVLAGCLGLPAVQAHSADRDGRLIVAAQRDRDRDAQRRDNRRDHRRDSQREGRREADRQQRGEWLTPDEHRELNRDLQRANREIYRQGRERR
jgi:hypothetical protein